MLGGVHAGGVCAWGAWVLRGCACPGLPGGHACLGGGVPRGVCMPGGCMSGGYACHAHPTVDRMTHTCKNITLAQLRCGR